MRKIITATVLAVALVVGAANAAFAGEGNGTSSSQGANAHGNAVSSGATPQPEG